MKNYKEFARKNIFGLIVIGTILICTLVISVYLIYSNDSFSTNSQASLKGPLSLFFTPTSISTASGTANNNVNVMVRTNRPMEIQGYTFSINFDYTLVKIDNLVFNIGRPCAGLSDDSTTLATVNSTGNIKICGEIQSAAATTLSNVSDNNLLTIKFTRLTGAASKITFDTSKVNAMFEVNSENFVVKQVINSYGFLTLKKVR